MKDFAFEAFDTPSASGELVTGPRKMSQRGRVICARPKTSPFGTSRVAGLLRNFANSPADLPIVLAAGVSDLVIEMNKEVGPLTPEEDIVEESDYDAYLLDGAAAVDIALRSRANVIATATVLGD